jgi:preprotein translocase subunit YajC
MDANFMTKIGSFFSGSGLLIILMIAMFAIMIIPQRRRDKKIKTMLAALKPGDRVRTIGGIYGTIGSVKDDVITLLVGPDKVRLVFARGAISTVEDVAVENTMDQEVKETK